MAGASARWRGVSPEGSERDDREDEIARLKSKVGEITMDNELLADERGQIAILRTAGRSMGAIAGSARSGETTISRSCSGTHFTRADIRRFTPPEPINCAGGVKRSSNEKPLHLCSW